MATNVPGRNQATQPVRPKVSIKMPKELLFVGSYHRIPVQHSSQLKWEDLKFIIPAGPKGGLVSSSRDRYFDPRPHLMLLVGYEPGKYVFQVRHQATDQLLFESKFEVTALWKNEKEGPSFWFTGIVGNYATGAAWGGGPASPQNVNIVPAMGTRRIAVLLVDTSSQRFTTDAPTLQGFRDRWIDELINGVTQGGVTRSVRQYYQEVSYNNFDITAEVFGPVQLPGSWTDYFTMDSNGSWAPQGSYWQAPWVHIAIGSLKTFLLGTYHGVSSKYLQEYLNEFCYRFNRREWEAQLPLRLLNACLTHTQIKLKMV